MKLEIIDKPLLIQLIGVSGQVEAENYKDTGLGLMRKFQDILGELPLEEQGTLHWAYFPKNIMFTGIEVKNPPFDTALLETREIKLSRYIRQIHKGPYELLPQTWEKILKQAQADGLKRSGPGCEIYGHWYDDPKKLITTVVIGIE